MFYFYILIYHYNYQAALRRVIHECTGTPLHPLPANIKKASYGIMKLQKVVSLLDIIDNINDPLKVSVSEHPLYMEQIGQVSTNVTICVFPLLLLNFWFKFLFHVSVMGFILSDVWISPVHVRIPRETPIKHPVNSKGFGFHIYFVGIKERSSLVRCEFCVAAGTWQSSGVCVLLSWCQNPKILWCNWKMV